MTVMMELISKCRQTSHMFHTICLKGMKRHVFSQATRWGMIPNAICVVLMKLTDRELKLTLNKLPLNTVIANYAFDYSIMILPILMPHS